jgi:FMN phosphatase YigB (HAD superfamily)
MKPELIIFDLGRVLVDFDFKKAIRDLKRHSPMTEDEIHRFFETTPLWDNYERGKISSEDFFKHLSKDLKLKGVTYEEFLPMWCDIFTEKADTVALLKRLRGRYRLAMLSNVNELHWRFIRGKHDFMSWFELPIASYAVGMRKPDAEIFHHILKEAHVKPSQALFTDDLEQHVTAAKAVGIRAHQFITAAQLEKEWADVLCD